MPSVSARRVIRISKVCLILRSLSRDGESLDTAASYHVNAWTLHSTEYESVRERTRAYESVRAQRGIRTLDMGALAV